jgi:hypothetical protein
MKYIALITLGCFCVLASYSNGRYAHLPRVTHPVVLWKAPSLGQRQLEAYASVYGITPQNMDSYRRWW